MTKPKIATFLLTIAAVLALASNVMAKGGGGGGGGASCAQIVAFDVTPGGDLGRPTLTTSYTVDNECVDHENMSAAALDYSNSGNSFTGRAVQMLSYGVSTYTSSAVPVTPGVTYTTTLTVYTPGGKIDATKTVSVIAPLA
jgi:hypothetical protein